MKKKRFALWGGICLVLLLAALPFMAACAAPAPAPAPSPTPAPAPDKVYTISWATYSQTGTAQNFLMDAFVKEVELRTNGRVKIDIYWASSLVGIAGMWQGIIEGQADMGHGLLGFEVGHFPVEDFINLPIESRWEDNRVGSRVVWDLHKAFPDPEWNDVKLLYLWTAPQGGYVGNKPVHTLEDLQGMELRTTGAGAEILQALGGTPVAMKFQDVYEALQKGIVDGWFASMNVLTGYRLAELVTHATPGPTPTVVFYTAMNLDSWNKLPSDLQQILEEVGEEWVGQAGAWYQWDEYDARQRAIDEYGLEIYNLSPEEEARWYKLIEPIYAKHIADANDKGLPGQEIWDTVHELKAKYDEIYKDKPVVPNIKHFEEFMQ